jgi:hypothetical protein
MACLNLPVTAAELLTVVDALERYYQNLMEEAPDPERAALRIQVVNLILRLEGEVGHEGGSPCTD